MDIPPKAPPPPLSKKEIFKEQGCLVSALWWVTYLLTFFSFQYCFSRIARRITWAHTPFDQGRKKAKPWWQDTALLIVVAIATGAFFLSFKPQPFVRCLAFVLLILTIVDLLNYHARVLWFDDLRPAIPDSSPYVWSHRRILFHAIISFATVVVIFAGLYTFNSDFAGGSPTGLLGQSFRTSVALDLRPHFGIVDAVQIGVSLFFIVVLLATIASTAYKRKELATPPEDRKAA